MSKLNRRQFISQVGAAAGTATLLNACATNGDKEKIDAQFDHGVASGDPLTDRVILWTRLTPGAETEQSEFTVTWQIAEDAAFKQLVNSGQATTHADKDFTVKIDADKLAAGKTYFYRFLLGDKISPVGRTRTLPEGDVNVANFAVISCSNFGHGYFNVYKEIANQGDLNAVLHLGDYIYEYDANTYQDPALKNNRGVKPSHEIIVLDDYRERYNLYRRDQDLQNAHAAHPFICVWDDHELANDAYLTGAQNHQENEGDWSERKAHAVQAYREWLPIRDYQDNQNPELTYRSFRFGKLAHLLMLDTRIIGRDKPIDYLAEMIWQQIPFDVSKLQTEGTATPLLTHEQLAKTPKQFIKPITVPFDLRQSPPKPVLDWQQLNQMDPQNLPEGYSYLPNVERVKKELLGNPDKQLLGAQQETWIAEQLKNNQDTTWQILGQQVLTGEVRIPEIRDLVLPEAVIPKPLIDAMVLLGQLGLPFNTDAWDGYNACRQRYLGMLQEYAQNPVSLAGDTHNGWAFELVPDGQKQPVAVEFATASVSSPGMETYLANKDNQEFSKRLVAFNENMKYQNSHQRGWMLLNLTPERCQCTWKYVSTVKSKTYQTVEGPTFFVAAGSHKLQKV